MQYDVIRLNGMVLSYSQYGERDKRLVLLTAERGKITAFVHGVRRQNSQLQAATRPFAMGIFELRPSGGAYTLQNAEIKNYFDEFGRNMEAVSYGYYFLELAAYYSRENMDGRDLLNLLYVSLKALLRDEIPNPLVRMIYEVRAMTIAGEFPDVFHCSMCGKELSGRATFAAGRGQLFCEECKKLGESGKHRQVPGGYSLGDAALYALQYMVGAPLNRLYTFILKEEAFEELRRVLHAYKAVYLDKTFASLEVLKTILA